MTHLPPRSIRRFRHALTLGAACLMLAPVSPAQETKSRIDRQPIEPTTSVHGMVVSETPLASAVGADVLAEGGNAVDAAVAVAFALAVTWPEAGNVAGGGFMMVAPPEDLQVWCVDYRETAPGAAEPTMFLENRTRFSHRQVGVPGTVAGLALAHERWGKRPWAQLLRPSIDLAEAGFEVDEALALSLNEVLDKNIVQREPDRFAELIRVYGKPDGSEWAAGDRLVLPDLAASLRQLADEGPAAFYTGSLAAAIAEDMHQQGGIITREDLAGYEAILRPAVHIEFYGHDVYAPPPPSAGGLTLAMMLHQLTELKLEQHPRDSPQALHLLAEVMRRAYHWRALTLGDSDFVDVPFEIGSAVFGRLLASSIDPDQATPSLELQPQIDVQAESPDTTHFSVIDADGLGVSNTYTLEMSWGSRMITAGTGLILNNEMGDFNREPGVTTTGGQIGTPANVIAPGKRMLSSQTPTIVRREGQTCLLVGSPGGRTITNTVLNVLVNVLVYDQPLAEAVDGPRQHHQWLPDRIQLEDTDGFDVSAVAALESMGHTVIRRGRQGSANCIAVDLDVSPNRYIGVADWRRGAAAVAPDATVSDDTPAPVQP